MCTGRTVVGRAAGRARALESVRSSQLVEASCAVRGVAWPLQSPVLTPESPPVRTGLEDVFQKGPHPAVWLGGHSPDQSPGSRVLGCPTGMGQGRSQPCAKPEGPGTRCALAMLTSLPGLACLPLASCKAPGPSCCGLWPHSLGAPALASVPAFLESGVPRPPRNRAREGAGLDCLSSSSVNPADCKLEVLLI